MNLTYILCFLLLPLLLAGLLGAFLMWLFTRGNRQAGDLSIEGEGALKAEADRLRAENQSLKGRLSSNDQEVSDLKGKLAAAAAGAGAATLAAGAATASAASDDDNDDTYALEWRNRYLAARVKYLEGRVAEAPAAKAKPVAKKKAPAKKKNLRKTFILKAFIISAKLALGKLLMLKWLKA